MRGPSSRKRAACVALAAVLACTGLAVSFAGSAGATGGRDGAAIHRAEHLEARVVARLNRPFVKARHELRRLSTLGSVRAHDRDRCNRAMASRTVPRRYTAFGAANRGGNVYCLSQPLTSPVNIADRPYFVRAIGLRGFAAGDFQIGRATGVDSLGMGYPTRAEDGHINGIVLAPLSLDWLDGKVNALRPARTFDVLVTDDHGTVLGRAGHRHTPPGRNVSSAQLVKAMLADEAGSGRFHLGGTPVASAFDTVAATHGSVHVAVSVRR
jgi:hypothetical protein